MRITPTKLRQNVYAILDEVLEKGTPVEVVRKGKVLKIVAEEKQSKLDRVKPVPDIWIGDPDDIFKIDWMKEWREPENVDAVEREMKARKRRMERARQKTR
jgi:hypothetical protein